MKCNNCKRKDYCEAHSIENDSCVASGYSDYVPQTNYDRIISKSPEELAELFSHMCCPYSLGGEIECNIENKGCKVCWLDWLKQEAKE